MIHLQSSEGITFSPHWKSRDSVFKREGLDAVFGVIADAAANGDEIALNGFGKFKVKETPEREGRNPATGDTITIKASRKLGFTPAKAVKDRLNG